MFVEPFHSVKITTRIGNNRKRKEFLYSGRKKEGNERLLYEKLGRGIEKRSFIEFELLQKNVNYHTLTNKNVTFLVLCIA